jgi:putative two-component system response regulator
MNSTENHTPQEGSHHGFGPDSVIRGSILAIDDDQPILELLKELLELNGYSVDTASEGREGLDVFHRVRPDLVISDIRMPHMDGLDVLARVREIDDTAPVILVTGHGDLEHAVKAVRRGAHDFLLKPMNPEILLTTVKRGLEHCRLKRFERDHTRLLEQEVENRTEELERTNELLYNSYQRIRRIQGAAIFALAKLAESRSGEMGYHLKRIQEYCRVLCDRLGQRNKYKDRLTMGFIDDLVQSSVLHDIGKVTIPDSILFNPRKFRVDEFEIMKQHTIRGGKALEEAANETGEESFLSIGKDVAFYHHERWDGSGYPDGLKEEQIPLAARIVSLADVYDALTTERLYKRAFSHEEALEMIKEERGRQFDPEIVDAFCDVERLFSKIREGEGLSRENRANRKEASG